MLFSWFNDFDKHLEIFLERYILDGDDCLGGMLTHNLNISVHDKESTPITEECPAPLLT